VDFRIPKAGVCQKPQAAHPRTLRSGDPRPSGLPTPQKDSVTEAGRASIYSPGPFRRGQPGGFYRVRYTGKPVYLPLGLTAKKSGMFIRFSGKLDLKTASDPQNYAAKTWNAASASSCETATMPRLTMFSR
jgi:hypothetical protein